MEEKWYLVITKERFVGSSSLNFSFNCRLIQDDKLKI